MNEESANVEDQARAQAMDNIPEPLPQKAAVETPLEAAPLVAAPLVAAPQEASSQEAASQETVSHDVPPIEEEPTIPQRPRVSFMGNSYDLTSMGALASGLMVLLSCLTCNQFAYCLPCLPLILGIIGLVMAKQAVDEERTRTWSWIGIGSTGVILVLLALAALAYLALMAFILVASQVEG